MQPVPQFSRTEQLVKTLPPLPKMATMRRSTTEETLFHPAPTISWVGPVRRSLPPNRIPQDLVLRAIGSERCPTPPDSQDLEEILRRTRAPNHLPSIISSQKRGVIDATYTSFFGNQLAPLEFYKFLEENKIYISDELPQLYVQLRDRLDFVYLLRLFLDEAVKLTPIENPMRENRPGFALYAIRLQELIEARHGRLFFAKMAFQVIRDTIQVEHLESSAPPSADNAEVIRAKEVFLQRLAHQMSRSTSPKDQLIKQHCSYLTEVVTNSNIKTVIPEWLVMNFLYLRCLNHDILKQATHLFNNDEKKLKMISNYMKSLSIRLQKDFNKMSMLDIFANPSLAIVFKAILT